MQDISRGELRSFVVKDPKDLRDRLYRPTLQPIRPVLHPPEALLKVLIGGNEALLPRDQRESPSCAGQALAALIDIERLQADGQLNPASAWMLYRMATVVEGVEAEPDAGVSLRSVIKACYHYGCCSHAVWPEPCEGDGLTPERERDARNLSLGAYYRVAPVLSDWHAALNEVGVIIASATLHAGWDNPVEIRTGGATFHKIDPEQVDASATGHLGHAFLVIGYTDEGFIILNSWGRNWARWNGAPGLCLWTYADWADSVMDAWVLRLGVPAPKAFEFSVGQQGLTNFGPVAAAGSTPARQLVGHYAHLDGGDFVKRGIYASSLSLVTETRDLLRTRKAEAPEKAYRGLLLRLDGALHDLKGAVGRALASKNDYKRRLRLYPFNIFWCPAAVPPFRAALGACETEACTRWAKPSERRDRLIEETSYAAWRAFERDVRAEAKASARRALRSILGEFIGLEDHEIRIQTFAEGALLLARWKDAVRPPDRDAFLRRLRSVDMVAPPLDRREFARYLLPLAQAMRAAEKDDGHVRRFRLHVPDEELRKRLRIGAYGGSRLQLMANANPRLPKGERLVGDDPDANWPDIETIRISEPEEQGDSAERRSLSQEAFVHGGAVARHLLRVLETDCREAGQRARNASDGEEDHGERRPHHDRRAEPEARRSGRSGRGAREVLQGDRGGGADDAGAGAR